MLLPSGVARDGDVHRARTILGRLPRRVRRVRQRLAQRGASTSPGSRRLLVLLRVVGAGRLPDLAARLQLRDQLPVCVASKDSFHMTI